MTELRRRQTTETGKKVPAEPTSSSKSAELQQQSHPSRLLWPTIVLLVCIVVFMVSVVVPYFLFRRTTCPLLRSPVASPSDETIISAGVLVVEDFISPLFSERALVCMPTVTRRSGRIEYVSNAVKSWRLATNGSTTLRRIAVFDMDVPMSSGTPAWLDAVFGESIKGKETPSWLTLLKRESKDVGAPRKHLHGDSEERVRWRSKEALDYAEVLRRCAELSKGPYVIVVQDDILFTERVNEVVDWCERNMVDEMVTDEKTGRRRMMRVCSVSLFDLPGAKSGIDGHVLDASNMVARVWKVDRVSTMEKYFRTNFDEAPVDWLADRICKSQRRKTLVMDPNPVRHRGKVSSFDQNNREGLLT